MIFSKWMSFRERRAKPAIPSLTKKRSQPIPLNKTLINQSKHEWEDREKVNMLNSHMPCYENNYWDADRLFEKRNKSSRNDSMCSLRLEIAVDDGWGEIERDRWLPVLARKLPKIVQWEIERVDYPTFWHVGKKLEMYKTVCFLWFSLVNLLIDALSQYVASPFQFPALFRERAVPLIFFIWNHYFLPICFLSSLIYESLSSGCALLFLSLFISAFLIYFSFIKAFFTGSSRLVVIILSG